MCCTCSVREGFGLYREMNLRPTWRLAQPSRPNLWPQLMMEQLFDYAVALGEATFYESLCRIAHNGSCKDTVLREEVRPVGVQVLWRHAFSMLPAALLLGTKGNYQH